MLLFKHLREGEILQWGLQKDVQQSAGAQGARKQSRETFTASPSRMGQRTDVKEPGGNLEPEQKLLQEEHKELLESPHTGIHKIQEEEPLSRLRSGKKDVSLLG